MSNFPTSGDIARLDWAFDGQPIIGVEAKSAVTTQTLDYALNGQPFVGQIYGPAHPVIIFVSIEEDLTVTDKTVQNTLPEISQLDLAYLGQPNIPQCPINITDTLNLDYALFGQPFIAVNFNPQLQDTHVETAPIMDAVGSIVKLNIQELFGIHETVGDPAVIYSDQFGVRINVSGYGSDQFGARINIAEFHDDPYSVQLSIRANDQVAVTDHLNLMNPLQPGLAVQGNIIYENPSNPMPELTATDTVVSYVPAGFTTPMGPHSYCDLLTASFQLNGTGGTFAFTSSSIAGDLGNVFEFYGLNGTVSRAGFISSNSAFANKYSGFFGVPLLNRQMQFVLFGSPQFNPNLVNQRLNIVGSNKWQTVSGAALSIANQAGASLQWTIRDSAYATTMLQGGMTGLQALSSLASLVGGTLRWNGGVNYIVSYPDKYLGSWVVPDCHVITANGIEYEKIKDIETGLTGTGILVIPTLPNYSTGTIVLPTGSGGSASITPRDVCKTTKILTNLDPPTVYQLPDNFNTVYIQILVPAGQSTAGSNQVSIQNFITTDPQQFFEFDVGGFNDEYIFYSNIGGRYVPQVKLDYKIFPNNPSVNQGHFVLAMYASVNDLNDQFNTAQQHSLDNQANALDDSYLFIRTYEGSINCMFFGSIPMIGTWATATDGNGITVQGIVESVQFNGEGLITVSVAQYLRLEFVQPLINITAN